MFQDLKAQIETWAALVEARIHLEPSLGLGHRLPTPSTAGLFRSASSPVAEEAEAVAGEVRQLLAKWMALQEKMAPCAFPKLEGKVPRSGILGAHEIGRFQEFASG